MAVDQATARIEAGHEPNDMLLTGLKLAVIGAILLPLVPIWTAVYTVLAIGWIWRSSPAGRYRLVFASAIGVFAAIYLSGWVVSAISAPADHVINGFVYVFGLPVGLWPSAAALALEVLLACLLAHRLWFKAAIFDRVYMVAALGFAGWSALSAVIAIYNNEAARPDVVLVAAAVWANWSCLGLLVFALVRSHRAVLDLVRTFVLAAAILAAGMALQLVLSDFSYVLTSANPEDFFERVRGSYYYHAPPVQMLVVVVPLALTLLLASERLRIAGVVTAVGIATVVLLNSTRGLSLALASGMGVFIVLVFFGQRRPRLTVLPALLLAVLLSQIFYVKPGTAPADPVISTELASSSETVAPAATDKVETFIASNGQRSGLAQAGIAAIEHHPIIGSGPGNAKIQPREDAPLETSSHVLGLDIAVMLGIPGLLFFAAVLGLPAIRLIVSVLLSRRSTYGVFRATLATSMVVFAVSSLFHPQERSEIIALIFLLSGLAMATFRVSSPQDEGAEVRVRPSSGLAMGASLLVAGFAGCLFITSPSYVFPAIEFVLRYRQALVDRPSEVATNSPLLGALVSSGLDLVGVPTNVRTMLDDPSELVARDSYILWSPAREKFYPRLREAAGIAPQLRYGQWMGISIPPDWWLLDNFQPNLQFLKAGPNFEVPIAVRGLEEVPLSAGSAFSFSPQLSTGSGPAIDLLLEGADRNTARLQQSGVERLVDFNSLATVALDANGGPLEISQLSADASLTVTERPALLPSLSPHLQVRAWVDGGERGSYETSNLNDLADLGGMFWHPKSATVIELTGPAEAFGAYRLKPIPSGALQVALPRSWSIEVRRPDGSWSKVDERRLVRSSYSDRGYFVQAPSGFQQLRISFPPDESAGSADFVGVGEFEIFPLAGQAAR